MRLPPLSIRVKLPLLICALLLAVAGSFSWAAYRGVSQAVVTTASDRLGSVTTQIAGLLQTSATQLLANARAVADSPAVRAYLRAPTPRMRAAALAALRPVGPAAQQIADVELVSTGGVRLLSLTDRASHGTPAIPAPRLAARRRRRGSVRATGSGRSTRDRAGSARGPLGRRGRVSAQGGPRPGATVPAKPGVQNRSRAARRPPRRVGAERHHY